MSKKMKELEENGASFEEIRKIADKIPNQVNNSDYVQCPYCERKFNPCKH